MLYRLRAALAGPGKHANVVGATWAAISKRKLYAQSRSIDAVLSLASRTTSAPLARVLSGGSDITIQEAVGLLQCTGQDLTALTLAADALRRQHAGDNVTYVVNRNVNYTNACVKGCGFCAFSRTASAGEAYWLPIEEVVRRATEARAVGATEVCIQAGLPPAMPPSLYEDTLRAVRAAAPELHIHAFSPEEVKYGAQANKTSIRDMLLRLRDAGVDSLPGTSAEILDDGLRALISKGRISTAEWVEVITTAHTLGISTTSTMMYGHAETPAHIAAHLDLLRGIQQRTGGFTEFVPLSFVASDAPMFREWQRAAAADRANEAGAGEGDSKSAPSPWRGSGLKLRGGPSGLDVLRVHAVSRVMLSRHIPNLQVSWVKEGLRMAQLLLTAGVNDLGGTLVNESISTAAGAGHGQLVRPATLRQLIRDAGRTPVQRDTKYRHLKAFPTTVTEGEAEAEAAGEPLHGFDEGDKESIQRRFGSFASLTASKENRFKERAMAGLRARGGASKAASATGSPTCGSRAFSTLSSCRPRFVKKGSADPSRLASTASGSSNVETTASAGPMREVTFSPSFTLVPTHECFNACTYCNFRDAPAKDTTGWLPVDSARSQLASLTQRAHHADASGSASDAPPVSEILILSGEVSPGASHRRQQWLTRVGDICTAVLDAGLLPHSNVGPLTESEMAALAQLNVSMGLMLEQITPALAALPHGVHRFAPSKRDPQARLAQLRLAGKLRIPFTTGILCGIGETHDDRLRSLEAIADVSRELGHIGEVIVQPYTRGSSQKDRGLEPTMDLSEMPGLVEAARAILPRDVVIQVPPNLVSRPEILIACLQAGATDLGGIGPVDVVNPDHPFPLLARLRELLASHGFAMRERLPLYPRHYDWLPSPMRARLERHFAA